MDLPANLSVPFNNHSLFAVTRQGGALTVAPITLGASAESPQGAPSFSQYTTSGVNPTSEFHLLGPANYSVNVPSTTFMTRGMTDLYGYTRNGVALNWYAEESWGSSNTPDPGTANLRGGSLFFSQQSSCSDDEEMFASLIFPTAISATTEASLKAEMSSRFAIQPSITNTILFDGSSTTIGNGTDFIYNTSQMTSDLLQGVYPNRSMTLGVSVYSEGEAFLIPYILKLKAAAIGANAQGPQVLVFHPGLANSIQAAGIDAISLTTGSQLTVADRFDPVNLSLFPGFTATGENASGGTVTPANTLITSITSLWTGDSPPYVVSLNHAPTGAVANVIVSSDTGAQAWQAIQTYISSATSAGYKVVLIGSASRWTFQSAYPQAPQWLQDFHDAKALMANGWRSAGAVAYIDLETDPLFGADPVSSSSNIMTVTSVNANTNQVTVVAPSQYLQVGNYVSWPGMLPPAAFITAISGNTLTLSQTPPASLVNTGLVDYDAFPWEHHPDYWNLDGQHFTYKGYMEISNLTATALQNGILTGN